MPIAVSQRGFHTTPSSKTTTALPGGKVNKFRISSVHNNSTYVLTHNNIKGHSFFYRDLKPLDTDSIFLLSKGQKVKLGDILFYDFIVVDKPINNQ